MRHKYLYYILHAQYSSLAPDKLKVFKKKIIINLDTELYLDKAYFFRFSYYLLLMQPNTYNEFRYGQNSSGTGSIQELNEKQVKICKLVPFPSIHSWNSFDKVMDEPRRITNIPVHVISILLAMFACMTMFSAQLWDMAITECNEGQKCSLFQDPDDTFARYQVYGIVVSKISNRKLSILVSAPITFLLCISLLILLRGTTALKQVPMYNIFFLSTRISI